MRFEKITEQESHYNNLEKMSLKEVLTSINKEDQSVPLAIERIIPQIEKLVEAIVDKMLSGGRLFYIGAGTSGRLGIVDASECPPTFGIPCGLVIGVIAGGEKAITNAVEFAEDSEENGWKDLQTYRITDKDCVIGITASGTTPYVISALKECKANKIITACITNNPGSPLSNIADFAIEVEVGPEFITGSTRMKSGTSQKLVLNMLSTSIMLQLGRVEGNKMVHMQLSNEKLVDRGVKMVMEQLKLDDYNKAKELLLQFGTVKKTVEGHAQY